jgi:hypothetical protein
VSLICLAKDQPLSQHYKCRSLCSGLILIVRQGVPSRLLYFPDEDHSVRMPHNVVRWHVSEAVYLPLVLADTPSARSLPLDR